MSAATASRPVRDLPPRQGHALLGVSSLTCRSLWARAFSSASLLSASQDVGRGALLLLWWIR